MLKLNEKHSIDLSLTRAYMKPLVSSWKDVLKKVRFKNINEDKNKEATSSFEVDDVKQKRRDIKVNQYKSNEEINMEHIDKSKHFSISNELSNLTNKTKNAGLKYINVRESTLLPETNNEKVIIYQSKEADFVTTNHLTLSKLTKKALNGVYLYNIDEKDLLALQCCTCCVGCWRHCSLRCVRCEHFISCPIYCMLGNKFYQTTFN
jgi:hypothetical protein